MKIPLSPSTAAPCLLCYQSLPTRLQCETNIKGTRRQQIWQRDQECGPDQGVNWYTKLEANRIAIFSKDSLRGPLSTLITPQACHPRWATHVCLYYALGLTWMYDDWHIAASPWYLPLWLQWCLRNAPFFSTYDPRSVSCYIARKIKGTSQKIHTLHWPFALGFPL